MATGSPSSVPQLERQWELAVAEATGFDPRVIHAWAVQEGAYAAGGTGHLNFLNISAHGAQAEHVTLAGQSPRGFAWYRNLQDAEQAAVIEIRRLVLHQTYAVAESPGAPVLAEHVTPASQIGLVAQSPWDEAHYGGPSGPTLLARFASLFGRPALTAPAQRVSAAGSRPGFPSGPAAGAGGYGGIFGAVRGPVESAFGPTTSIDKGKPGEAAGPESFDLTDVGKLAAGILGDVEAFILTWVWRGLLIVGGAVLIVAGLALMALGTKATAEGR